MPDVKRESKRNFAAGELFDLALTVAVPLSTQLAAWTGRGRREEDAARQSDGPVTPATGAFVIWAPIFASLIGYGIGKLRLPGGIQDKVAVNLVRISLAGNLLWNFNSQFKGFGWQSVALIAASAVSATGAVARYERIGEADPTARLSANLTAPLAGWLSVATFANIDTTQNFTRSSSRRWLNPGSIVPIAAILAASGVVATRSNPFYAAAAAWGLGGIAIKNARKEPKLASTAVAGLAALAAVFVLTRRAR